MGTQSHTLLLYCAPSFAQDATEEDLLEAQQYATSEALRWEQQRCEQESQLPPAQVYASAGEAGWGGLGGPNGLRWAWVGICR